VTGSNPPFDTVVRRYGTAAIDEAARLVLAGLPVAIPTETVYGLAADSTDASAVARIYEAKGRPSFNPLIVHVADREAAEALALFSPVAHRLALAFWPGPLTMVLPRRADCPVASLATAGLDSIAIRCPAHEAMQALLAAVGRPLAAPSANASGRISPTRAEHVLASLGGRIPLIVDAGPARRGLESTIAAPADGHVRLLRPGPITADDLAEAAGVPVEIVAIANAIEAPGQLASHYAPSKSVRLNASEARPGEWLIGFGDVVGDATLSASANLSEAAANLFDLLHQADQSSAQAIAVAPVPDTGLGRAINDRLGRAAA
jgi:L-threonylcarbamoyladenylate synthase